MQNNTSDMSKETAAALCKILFTKEDLTPEEKYLIAKDYLEFENTLKKNVK
jgi:hypothetical protein